MKLTRCNKPEGELKPIDTPLNVRGELFQTYRKDLPNGDCEYYEHNQTRNRWFAMEKEFGQAIE